MIISDLEEDDAMVASAQVNSIEAIIIDKCVIHNHEPSSYPSDFEIKQVSAILDPTTLSQMLEDRATCGKFNMAVGSIDVHDGSYLFNDSNIPETYVTGQMLDDVMVSATHATPP